MLLYTASQKGDTNCTLVHIFAVYRPVFEIFYRRTQQQICRKMIVKYPTNPRRFAVLPREILVLKISDQRHDSADRRAHWRDYERDGWVETKPRWVAAQSLFSAPDSLSYGAFTTILVWSLWKHDVLKNWLKQYAIQDTAAESCRWKIFGHWR